MFEYQFMALHKSGYRCIGIDFRGFGRSDKPWTSYNYDVFADDIKQVISALNL
jgi:non-heme chloroperoxidase